MANIFEDSFAANLVGLWEFGSGAAKADTGLGDGIAQNGVFEGGAKASAGQLRTDGRGDYFDVEGDDGPFQLDAGTIVTEFTQTAQVGGSPDTIINRGEASDTACEGHLDIRVTADHRVEVVHSTGDLSIKLSTDAQFHTPGETVRLFYGWNADTGATLRVINLSQGTESLLSTKDSGLTLDIGDADDERFTFAARESDDGQYDRFFHGAIDYVALYDDDVLRSNEAPDGVVSGTRGDDVIDLDYAGDPQGDRIDAGDAIQTGAGPDDDIVDAGAGEDRIESGEGSDTVFAGTGDDTVLGAAGDDLILGDGDLGSVPATVRERFEWDLAPDPNGTGPIDNQDDLSAGFTQNTGSVDVTFSVLDAGAGVDNRFETDVQATQGILTDSAAVDANSSFESVLNGTGNSADYALDFSENVQNVSFRINDLDGDAVVRVVAFDAAGDAIPISLVAGQDVALSDTDSIAGADTAEATGPYRDDADLRNSLLVEIDGPVSRIVITHDQDGPRNTGINVTDVYFDAVDPGAHFSGNDDLAGGEGDDTIFGDAGSDTLNGDAGNDRIDLGGDRQADLAFGGDDRDTFTGLGQGDAVDGGEGGEDLDTLDLTGAAEAANLGGTLRVEQDKDNAENGLVRFFDKSGTETGSASFANIETIIGAPICFTPNTLIATPRGECRIQDLREGDRVITRDNGIQDIRWTGHRSLRSIDLLKNTHLRPIWIRRGALGGGLPERDLMLSPNHRVLVTNDKTALYFEEREVLVAAKHLTGLDGVEVMPPRATTYFHLLFDQHEVILSNGAWTESFQPGDRSLDGVGNAQRSEIFELFPELRTAEGVADYQAARRSLKKHEARVLFN